MKEKRNWDNRLRNKSRLFWKYKCKKYLNFKPNIINTKSSLMNYSPFYNRKIKPLKTDSLKSKPINDKDKTKS